MLSYEDISVMLADIGPALDIVGISGMEDEDAWYIALDDEGDDAIELSHDAENAKLVFTTNLGQPPEHALRGVCMDVLAFNLGWFETGGARIGRDPNTGEFVLLHDIVLYELTPSDVRDAIVGFIQAALGLRTVIAAAQPSVEDDVSTPSSDENQAPALRV